MNEIKLTTYIKYIIVALIIDGLFFLSGTLINGFGVNENIELALKIALIIVICIYAYKRDEFNSFFNIHFSPVYLLIVAIPVVISIILQNCPLDFEPYPSFIIATVASTLTTAIWEELFFRYVGCSLFEQDGKYKWYNIIFLALVFSLVHSVNMLTGAAVGETLFQLLFTFGLGLFTLALYINTKAIIVPIFAHFCINSVQDFYNLFATDQARAMAYIGNLEDPVFAVYVLILIALSIIIFKRRDCIF